MMARISGLPVLIVLLLATSCSTTDQSGRVSRAQVLASAAYPGGHFELLPDNGLRVLVGFNEILLDRDGMEQGRNYYGSRPLQLPLDQFLVDRELLRGPGDRLASCRRDGYIELWRDADPDEGFSSIGEQYSPLPVWPGGQYRVRDVCRLLEDRLVSTGREQSVVCLDYNRRELWSFLMGAPARLLYMLEQETIIAASEDGYLYALDPAGNLLWKLESASHCAAILPGGRLVYLAREGALACVDSAGNELWRSAAEGRVDELRNSGTTLWYRLDGALHALDAEGRAVPCKWPAELAVRDILSGLNGEVFAVGIPRDGAAGLVQQTPQQPSPLAPSILPGAGAVQLFCYDSQGRLIWLYDRMEQDFSLIPAHDRQCWIIRLDLNAPELRRIGLPFSSQGA